MTLPSLIVEAAFGGAGNTAYLQFGDATRGLFGTGTFGPAFVFTDVTNDVRAVSTNRGKQRTLDAYRPGTMTVALDNRSGNYDPNNLSGTYVAGGATLVRPMIPVRARASFLGTTYNLFYGYADKWDVNYRIPSDAITTVDATDGFKVLAAAQPMSPVTAPVFRSSVSNQGVIGGGGTISVAAPAGLATGDVMIASIAETATDISATPPPGFIALAMTANSGPTGMITYYKIANTTDPGNTFTWSNLAVGNTANLCVVAYSASSGLDGWAVSSGRGPFVQAPSVSTNSAPTLDVLIVVNALTIAGPAIVNYAFSHPFGYTGRLANTVASSTSIDISEIAQAVSGNLPPISLVGQLAGDAARIAHAVTLAPAILGAGEDSGARIGRILTNVGWSATDRDLDTGNSTVQGTNLSSDAMSEIASVMLTELGDFYMAADGKATFRNRARKHQAAAANIYNAFVDNNYQDVTVAYDDELIVNSATGTNIGGQAQTASDATSIGKYLTKSYAQSGLWNTEDIATRHWAESIVTRNKDPEQRIETLKFRLGSDDTLTALILNAQFGDYFRITRTPPAGDVIQTFVFLINVAWTITPMDWDVTLTFASAAGFGNAIVFGVSTFGNATSVFTY